MSSFDINTNVASLQAQQYLDTNNSFQGHTINEVTSGLRIVNSGDDAAGLAVANGYRSDEAVLTQGIQNANQGLSQLQIADGGISNISQLLDRATTLATESASGTFTGSRAVLNSEFQSVIGEINRQSQAIGLNQGGSFAQNLSVFIGGGNASGNITAVENGSVSVDLGQSTVDAKSLGLQGVQAIGTAGTDIGTGSAATSVSDIIGNATNVASEANGGYTTFSFQGPGFGNSNPVNVSVNLTGVTDANTLVTALNTAIENAGNGSTQQATAFKNAGITASLNTDATGKTQLTFDSSNAAFQVAAGDKVSQALLGNFAQNAVLTGTDQGATVNTAGATTLTLTINSGANAISLGALANIGSGGVDSKAQIVAGPECKHFVQRRRHGIAQWQPGSDHIEPQRLHIRCDGFRHIGGIAWPDHGDGGSPIDRLQPEHPGSVQRQHVRRNHYVRHDRRATHHVSVPGQRFDWPHKSDFDSHGWRNGDAGTDRSEHCGDQRRRTESGRHHAYFVHRRQCAGVHELERQRIQRRSDGRCPEPAGRRLLHQRDG